MKPIRHIAVNTRFLLKGGLEGMGRFTHEILSRWVKDHPDVRFSFFFDRAFDPKFIYGPNVKGYVLNPSARHPLLFYVWFEWRVASMLRQLKPDIFFSPDGFLSLRSETKQVPVFHDLSFMHYPEDVKRMEAWFYHRYFPRYAEKAARIIVVSEFTKSDVQKQFGVSPDKMDVVYNACSAQFHPLNENEKIAVRTKYTDRKKYFYFVGAIQPRKNLVNLVSAFERFKNETQSDWKLIIVGRKAWNFEEIIHSYRDAVHKADIVFTGYLADEELNAVAASAEALCYVPYFEGFGIPLVEAMQAGTAVITSNLSSMPEVAGDAALFCDPMKPESITEALINIYQSPELKAMLIHKGSIRKMAFSWSQSAALAWESLEKA